MQNITYDGKEWKFDGMRKVTCSLGVLDVVDLKRRGEKRSVQIQVFQQSVQRICRRLAKNQGSVKAANR
ncbi:MAG: hypothetical protein NUV42_02515 [Candidatus Yonathbacteria bacterium]|nr:hypothetical protein [Candidatus Yonathbacteria bacterium]